MTNNYRDIIDRVVKSVSLKDRCAEEEMGECSGCGRCPELKPHATQLIADLGADRIGATLGLTTELKREIAGLIDHTILKPETTAADVIKLCQEADKYGFASVCTNPCWIKLCRETVKNPDVRVCGVSGFPLGANRSVVKAAEAGLCAEDGADEVDMVMNVGFAKNGDWDKVEKDISAVVEAGTGAKIKVIIEACLLTDEEKVKACLCAVNAGAHFVKTSTGFSKWGAKASDVALMRRVVGPDIGVKAAGGIKDFATALEMVGKGADRIGASAGVAIVKG
jgi:deoxyribose-phosphate aldolase